MTAEKKPVPRAHRSTLNQIAGQLRSRLTKDGYATLSIKQNTVRCSSWSIDDFELEAPDLADIVIAALERR